MQMCPQDVLVWQSELVNLSWEPGSSVELLMLIWAQSSVGANMVLPTASAYQVSKAAVSRLTEFVDAEYSQQGVNCVAMHPGSVLTEMSNKIIAIRHCK